MNPKEILAKYELGTITAVFELNGGIIHKTWKVESSAGSYILQKVSRIFSPVVMEDIREVLGFLKQRDFLVMDIIYTKEGNLFESDGNNFWRLYSYIEGKTCEYVNSEGKAFSAGKLLGRLHNVLNDDFTYQFKHKRPLKHNIGMVFDLYMKASQQDSFIVGKEFKDVASLPMLDLPKTLRSCVFHGDPKISNFIFSSEGEKAISMVDFDDCGRDSSILYELGSAFRSWSEFKQDGKASFNLNYFFKAFEGYCIGAKNFLDLEENALIPQAILLQTLQGTARYLTDYVEDYYFSWDSANYASRKEHNLARARYSLALFNDIKAKKQLIGDFVARQLT